MIRSVSEVSNNNHNASSASPILSQQNQGQESGTLSASSTAHTTTQSQPLPQPEHCLETLLRNIEGLLAIAAHNARQQQSQLHLQKGEKIFIIFFNSNQTCTKVF